MAARSAKESDADHGGDDDDDVFHEVGVSHFYGDNAKQFGGGGGGGEDKLSSKDSIDNETLGGEVILDHDAGVGGGGKGGDENSVKAQAEKYSDVSSAGAEVQTDSPPGDLVSEGHHDGQLPAQSLLK